MQNLSFCTLVSCYRNFNKLLLLHYFTANFDSIHIQRDEFVVTLRQCLEESLLHTLFAYYRCYAEHTSEYDHVEYLGVLQFSSLVHSIDTINIDILAGRRVDDTVALIDENAAWLYARLELVERRLVENYSNVVLAEYW